MVGILDRKFCISATAWKGSYTPSKVYLGVGRSLPNSVYVTLRMEFRNKEEEQAFFDFWLNVANAGAKPFYVYTSLYGIFKYYLVQADGALEHTKRPLAVTGKFLLYTTRTLEENIPPHIEDREYAVDMDSTANYIYIEAQDFDALQYDIVSFPQHGNIENVGGGSIYYTPDRGYSGKDRFRVRVTDEIGASAEATVTINIVNWKLQEKFKLELDTNGILIIDYVDPSTLDPLVVQAVDEMSTGGINRNGEYEIDITQTQHIDNIVKTADDEWLITPK